MVFSMSIPALNQGPTHESLFPYGLDQRYHSGHAAAALARRGGSLPVVRLCLRRFGFSAHRRWTRKAAFVNGGPWRIFGDGGVSVRSAQRTFWISRSHDARRNAMGRAAL